METGQAYFHLPLKDGEKRGEFEILEFEDKDKEQASKKAKPDMSILVEGCPPKDPY
jgi:hypothetical protein